MWGLQADFCCSQPFFLILLVLCHVRQPGDLHIELGRHSINPYRRKCDRRDLKVADASESLA